MLIQLSFFLVDERVDSWVYGGTLHFPGLGLGLPACQPHRPVAYDVYVINWGADRSKRTRAIFRINVRGAVF